MISDSDEEFQDKLSLLKENGFLYNFDRDIFVNRSNLTIVSIEYIQDNAIKKLNNLFTPNRLHVPRFFFNDDDMPQDVKDILVAEFFPKHRKRI